MLNLLETNTLSLIIKFLEMSFFFSFFFKINFVCLFRLLENKLIYLFLHLFFFWAKLKYGYLVSSLKI